MKEQIKNIKENEKRLVATMWHNVEEVADYKGKLLVCDWTRGFGKTYAIMCKITLEKPKTVVYKIEQKYPRKKLALQLFNEFLEKYHCGGIIEQIDENGEIFNINWSNGEKTKLFIGEQCLEKLSIVDKKEAYCFVDDYVDISLEKEYKQTICFTSEDIGTLPKGNYDYYILSYSNGIISSEMRIPENTTIKAYGSLENVVFHPNDIVHSVLA